jgi:3,8-divinyl chlorophyllide a/chlorophyllide a reductase subunit Y
VSGYEGSELLVARLLIESGAEVPYVGTACPRTEWSAVDRAWLEATAPAYSTARRWNRISRPSTSSAGSGHRHHAGGAARQAVRAAGALFHQPDFRAPLMGVAGAGSLAQVINGALANQGRFDTMQRSSRVSAPAMPPASGRNTPQDHPEFKAKYARQRAKQAAAKSSTATH